MAEGIDEIMDVIIAVEETAEAIEAAKADGSINWLDLPKLGGPVVAWRNALEGSEKIVAQAKDLDSEELQEVITRTFAALQKLGTVLLGPK